MTPIRKPSVFQFDRNIKQCILKKIMKQETVVLEKKKKLSPEQQELVNMIVESLKEAAKGKMRRVA